MYYSVWKKFNQFVIKIDQIPDTWEEKVGYYCAHLINDLHCKSATIKTYVSAIKTMLSLDGYKWNNELLVLSSITKACKRKNDVWKTRLPIRLSLLESLMCEAERHYRILQQSYLEYLYKTALIVGYYGLFRVGELAMSEHVILIKNVHVALNKDKITIVLETSKTHSKADMPQTIIIEKDTPSPKRTIFCPVKTTHKYLKFRNQSGGQKSPYFLCFSDGSAIPTDELRKILRKLLTNLGFESNLYDVHSLRIGRASDLLKVHNKTVDQIKNRGRWKSNAVFRYLRNN